MSRQILPTPNMAVLVLIVSILWFCMGEVQNAIFFAVGANTLLNLDKQKK